MSQPLDTSSPAAGQSMADELVDSVVPSDVDWRRLTVGYPRTAIALAAVGGFLLGYSRGRAITAALAAYAADTVTESVNEFVGGKVI